MSWWEMLETIQHFVSSKAYLLWFCIISGLEMSNIGRKVHRHLVLTH